MILMALTRVVVFAIERVRIARSRGVLRCCTVEGAVGAVRRAHGARRRRPRGRRRARRSRCSARAAAARRRCCGRSPACSRSTRADLLGRRRPGAACRRTRAALRADVPGVRASSRTATSRGNVEFGLRMAGADRADRAATGRRGARSRRPRPTLATGGWRRFSGGEQQRVALARALAVAPRLLMLDEPLGALDRVWRTRLLDEIRALLERPALPALYVTHDHDEAFAIADRVAVMRDGRVVQAGPPADVWRAPADAWTAAFLGFGPRGPGDVRDGRVHTPWGALPRAAGAGRPGRAWSLRPDGARIDHRARGRRHGRRRSAFAGTRASSSTVHARDAARDLVGVRRDRDCAGRRRSGSRSRSTPDALLVYPRSGRLTPRWRAEPKVEDAARATSRERDPVLRRMVQRARRTGARTAGGRSAALRRARADDLLPAARGSGRRRDPRAVRRAVRRSADTRGGARACRSRRCAASACRAPRPRRSATSPRRSRRGSSSSTAWRACPTRRSCASSSLVRGHRRVDRAHVPDVPARPARRVARAATSACARASPGCTTSEPLTPKELEAEGERFRPYRSLVAWYCWRAADTVLPE